ncbi:VanZ family protein [Mesobacillus selenatarsenatis]|uniref:VanZ family protein n=1 Tax=Mesobacillus selenatarsenatis TaxID=388741 RepID=UPI0005AAA2C4|nr:VanZ family protein [Mesobacillus selenatarsenatis]
MVLDYQLLFGLDKQLHFVSYAVISASIGVMIILIFNGPRVKQHINVVWMTLVSIGIFEEYRQYQLPDRSAEFIDALANILGVTVGLAIPVLLLYLNEHRKLFFSKIFKNYILIMMTFLIGLLFLNERPFYSFEENFLEKLRTLSAFIGW